MKLGDIVFYLTTEGISTGQLRRIETIELFVDKQPKTISNHYVIPEDNLEFWIEDSSYIKEQELQVKAHKVFATKQELINSL